MNPRCPMCGEEEESIIHMVCHCQEVQQIWRYSPLRLEVDRIGDMGFIRWIEKLKEEAKEKTWWSLFWSLLWGIWIRRNKWAFQQERTLICDVIHRAVGLVGEYEIANEMMQGRATSAASAQRWKAPQEGHIKFNSDAAMLEGGLIGMGAVGRDWKGDVVVAAVKAELGSARVDVAEACAARHAISVAMEAGITMVELE